MKKKIEKDDNFDIISDESFLASGEHKLVIAAVNRGFATAAVEEARANGGEGAIIIEGRGVSKSERKFFGFTVEPENEIIMMVVKEENVYPVIRAIYAAVDYKSPGRGIVFALPISCVSGLTHGKGEN